MSNNLLTKEKLKKYQELKKQANDIYKEVRNELLEKAVEVLKWKNENLETKYVLDYSKDIYEIRSNAVVIVVYERWAYGGAEDHYYNVQFDEIFSNEWKKKAIEELNVKKLRKEKKEKEIAEKQKLQREENERKEYERLKAKFGM